MNNKPEGKRQNGKGKRQTYCVWVKNPLRYVNAKNRKEARRGYRELFRRYPNELAVIEYARAKAMGLVEG